MKSGHISTTLFIRRFLHILFIVGFIATLGCGGCDEETGGTDNNDTADAGPDLPEGCVDEDGDGVPVGDTCQVRPDCNDDEPLAYPGSEEVCDDGIDNDCDGAVDEGCPECTEGATEVCGKNEGICEEGTRTCRDGEWSECEGGVQPGAEVCDGVDNDCDGAVDEQPEQLCDDGLACNGQEVCESGSCTDGDPIDCSMLNGPCMVGECSEKDRGCRAFPKPDGETCDDGLFCTENNVCQAGECVGDPRDCSSAGDQCNTGVCNEDQDTCISQPVSDGTTCDDGEFCTVNDVCTTGSCGGSARDCSGAGDQCNSGVCDESADACVKDPITDGTPCDDGLYCNVNETCQAGQCTGGAARQCGAAGGSCRTGVCDEAMDACDGNPVPDGTGCDDGQYCTDGDACSAGTCVGGPPRDCSAEADQCNDGVCNEMKNTCESDPKMDGTICDDGLFCTANDVCTTGTCGGVARDCSSLTDECNTGICDETDDACEAQPVSDGSSCDDGEFCTVNDVCVGGTCDRQDRDCSGTGDQCNDGVCDDTQDACVKQPVMDGKSCNDGEFCTVADSCSSGTCTGPSRDCTGEGGICTVGICDDVTDQCTAEPKPDGTSCDDSEFCTVNDFCTAGVCNGAARSCDNVADFCNDGVCNETDDTCDKSPKPDGTVCNDLTFCTVNDSCTAGTCDGEPRDCSNADSQCNNGVCNETAKSCDAEPKPDGTTCTDGLFCTVGDSCQDGTCESGGARDCSSATGGDICLDPLCDEANNVCDAEQNNVCCDDTRDADLDGYDECQDCDDTNGGVFPGATERCNGIDDDCDGSVDEDFDVDGDGYSVCANDPELFDCDDNNANVNPGTPEICDDVMGGQTGNGIDDNCNGYVDEGCDPCDDTDPDGDGFTECDGDCAPNDGAIYPGATEICDGLDNDCNIYTTKNCGVSEPCNHDAEDPPDFSNDPDICMDDMICACEVNASGKCTGTYLCTAFCNASFTGMIEDGCESDQTCRYDLLRSANVHGCAKITETPGSKRGGETCADDSECRSNSCDKICIGPGCNQTYCLDWCGSDDYCPKAGTTCYLRTTSSNIDGRCHPDTSPFLGSDPVGTSCSDDGDCENGHCVTDPDDGSTYCTEACCGDADCPSGYGCNLRGTNIDTSIVFPPDNAKSCSSDNDCTGEGGVCYNGECAWRLTETSPMCVRKPSGLGTRSAGQACSQNSDCRSNFCEADMDVCVETCCSDANCPTGLICELQTVQTLEDRATGGRICVNLSREDEVWERM